MALAEKAVKEVATRTPARYAGRVRWLAVIYFVLFVVSVAIVITIVWRSQFFITLAQRSNVETLTLAIIMVLSLYYIATTFRGFLGSVRMLFLNLPAGGQGDEAKEKIEQRKHSALKTSKEPKYAFFDKAICIEGKPGDAITWELKDEAGKLGTLEVDGVRASYYPVKDGMNASLFEFLAEQLQEAIQKREPESQLQVVQWSSIDEDQASTYYSTTEAFRNLASQLGKGNIWPTVEITEEDVGYVEDRLHSLMPALRNESLLPDMEYEVEYSVPILPEPLGFLRLTRPETRADPLITMGCASLIMLFVMAALTFMILLPPWVPSR